MSDTEDIKQKTRQIYEVLPQIDDQRCGYRTCGQFARAVAEGKAPCNGCVVGGTYVAAKVCQIMGVPLNDSPQHEAYRDRSQNTSGNSIDIKSAPGRRGMGIRLANTRRIRMGSCGMHAGYGKRRRRR